MSILARIPSAIQRFVASDATCDCIHFCAFGEEPVRVSVDSVKAAFAAVPAQQEDDRGAWSLVYDVMKVEKQTVHFEDAHLERIVSSYQSVAKRTLQDEEVAYTKRCLRNYIAELTSPETAAQNLKFMTWVGSGTVTPLESRSSGFVFVLFFIKSFFPPAEWYQTGTTLALMYDAHRVNPNAKTVQNTLRERAAALQKSASVFEVLLVHEAADHYLIPEGSRSNYFLVSQDNQLLCSAEEDILVGITLRAARKAALRANLGAVHHQKLTLKELCEAKSFVMLGTSPGTLPVREILLYNDQKGKLSFEAAAKDCGVDIQKLSKLKVRSENPPVAVLVFEVHNAVVDGLMRAYNEESMT